MHYITSILFFIVCGIQHLYGQDITSKLPAGFIIDSTSFKPKVIYKIQPIRGNIKREPLLVPLQLYNLMAKGPQKLF